MLHQQCVLLCVSAIATMAVRAYTRQRNMTSGLKHTGDHIENHAKVHVGNHSAGKHGSNGPAVESQSKNATRDTELADVINETWRLAEILSRLPTNTHTISMVQYTGSRKRYSNRENGQFTTSVQQVTCG
jgi:hypothetical protein